jgi:hypothetical protein
MFRLSVLQDQRLILALGGGMALLTLIILAYVTYWRAPEQSSQHRRVPWVLFVVYVAMGLFGVIYTLIMALYPPNW